MTERTEDSSPRGPWAIKDKAGEVEDVCVCMRCRVVASSYGVGGLLLTFLHGLERIVRLDKFHRVGDFLALQNVITQTQV